MCMAQCYLEIQDHFGKACVLCTEHTTYSPVSYAFQEIFETINTCIIMAIMDTNLLKIG